MHIIKCFPHAVIASSLLFISVTALAHEGHDQASGQAIQTSKMTPPQGMNIDDQHEYDHRKEHGAQIYAVTTVDHKWRVNEDTKGVLSSEIESRIGTDEHKVFIKAHINKPESYDADYDLKLLYSRMISDFWDAQLGLRYRTEKSETAQNSIASEEKLDAVLGLHGMAPYFFETDAYLYLGEDNYSALSVETERDVLLSQKLIVKPYLDLNVVLNDDSQDAKRSGLSRMTTGLETRYELSKKMMPYIDIAYEYSKGNVHTAIQSSNGSERHWLYGAGIRFKF